MSKGKDDLFYLIKSMSKSEKRYFKMEAKKAGNKTSNHIKLFDAINKLEEYDEEVLKKKLKKEKFIEHLSAEKRYLYQAVLKSIRNFRGDQSIFAQIKTMVIDANYLLERALHDQAGKILDKAAKLAEKIDDTVSLLEINVKRQLLYTARIKKDHKQDIFHLMNEKNKIVDLLLKKLELRDILNRTRVDNVESNQAHIIEHIKGKESFLDQTQNLHSFFALLWNYSITAQYYTGIGELEKLTQIRSKIVELWNQHPVIKEEFFLNYLIDVSNISSSYFAHNQMELAFEYLQKLENEKPKNSFERIFIFERVAIKKLIHFMSEGNFDEALLLVPGIESALEKYQVGKSSSITIKSNIAILFFCIENFHSCLIWVNKIIRASKSNIRLDIQRSSRLMSIIAQIGNDEDYETIDNFCRSTQRYFIKSDLKNKNQVELILLDYLWKYHKTAKGQRKDILNRFKVEIEEFLKHPTKKMTLGLEEFHFWIRSKLEKKPIALLIKDSYRTRNKN